MRKMITQNMEVNTTLAESGAQTAEVGDAVADFVDWMKKRGPLGAGGHPSRAFIAGHLAGVRAALAAQSQGAQAVSGEHTKTLTELLACFMSWEPQVRVLGNVRADDAAEAIRAALAAKAEAPAVVFANDGREPDWQGYAEAERAQQAAAPGALDADEMARLRRLMVALGHADAFQQPDDYVRRVMCTVLGQAAREMERLRALLNTPELHDFAKGVVLEAAHQRERWSTSHDGGKEPADWFWLLGYLGGKALKAHMTGDTEKALHHTISTAAACANWHAAVLGKTSMRPGIEPPADVAAQLDGGQGEGNAHG